MQFIKSILFSKAVMKKITTVLSIDGGGVRGIIPAVVLSEMERITGKHIYELFDYIAATSTGGIIALSLSKPDPDKPHKPFYIADDIVKFYLEESSAIFRKTFLRKVYTFAGVRRPRYSHRCIEEVFDKYLGDIMLSESLTDLVLTGYDIERKIPLVFKSSKAKFTSHYNFPFNDIARAMTAAPTYFAPHTIYRDSDQESFTVIDGGVFANNPAMIGLTEAFSGHPKSKEYMVVSLGTGHQTKRYQATNAKKWGILQWGTKILEVTFDGLSDSVDHQLSTILQSKKKFKRYYRFQPVLMDQNTGLDNASTKNLRELKLIGEDLVREYDFDITQLCEKLVLLSKQKKR